MKFSILNSRISSILKFSFKSLPFLALIFAALTAAANSDGKNPLSGDKAIADDSLELAAPKLVVGGVKDSETESSPANLAADNVAGLGANSDEAGNDQIGTSIDAVDTVEKTKVDTAKMKESEIPVLTNSKDVKKGAGGQFQRLIITLGVLFTVLGGAVFALKRWTAKAGSKSTNTRIQILTQHHLGPKKSLAIIQVAGESILIGITDHSITMLKSLALIDDEIPENMPRNFDGALDEMEFENGQGDEGYDRPVRTRRDRSEDDEFAMQGLSEIRDKVSNRLRSLKNF
jgi:flagellar protein FliO/FliZ